MKTLDVLLVLPPMYQTGRIPDYNPKEPMGLMCLASVLRKKGWSVEILDADILALTIDETVKEIFSRQATIIGFSILQRALPSVKILVEKLRQHRVVSHICCGGFTATLSARHILEKIPQIDSIVLGDGEYVFSKLVEALIKEEPWQTLKGTAYRIQERVIFNSPSEKPDVNILPFPARDLLTLCLQKTNYATILASRGCYGLCNFCSNCSFEQMSVGNNWRGRNPTDVVNEIEMLQRDFGVKVFKFNDPNIFGPGKQGRQHVVEICKAILQRKILNLHLMGFCRASDLNLEVARLMRMAGFERLLIGFETSDLEVLRLLKKGETIKTIRNSVAILREVGIDLIPGFMIFNPYTTLKTLKRDIVFLEEYGFTPTLSKTLRVFDGIALQKVLEAEGRLIKRSPLEGYHEYLVEPKIAAIYMALKTFYVEWIDSLKKVYQNEIWGIKRAPSFVEREVYYSLTKQFFVLEIDLLKHLIVWIERGFRFPQIVNHIEHLKTKLIQVEDYIVEASGQVKSDFLSQLISEKDMAGRISSILTNKTFRTFPEQYRWKDD